MGLQEKFNVLALRNRFIPGWIRFILVMPGLVAGSYRWYSFTGLYRYLANLQLDVMGSYYVILTGLIMFFMLLLPAILVMFIVAPYYEHRALGQGRDISVSNPLQKINTLAIERPGLFVAYLMSFLAMIGFLGTAIYFFAIYGLTSSEMIDLDTIQRRHIHNTRPIAYVTVNVEFQCDAMYVLEEEIGAPSHVKKEIAYIPLKAKKSLWGKTFLVATTYSGSFECVDGFHAIKGMMRPRGLPGMIRDVYIDDGILSTDDEYMMIEHQAKPDDIIVLKRVFAFCAAISLAIFLFIHIKKKPLA